MLKTVVLFIFMFLCFMGTFQRSNVCVCVCIYIYIFILYKLYIISPTLNLPITENFLNFYIFKKHPLV